VPGPYGPVVGPGRPLAARAVAEGCGRHGSDCGPLPGSLNLRGGQDIRIRNGDPRNPAAVSSVQVIGPAQSDAVLQMAGRHRSQHAQFVLMLIEGRKQNW
jgi:hypothetical protein